MKLKSLLILSLLTPGLLTLAGCETATVYQPAPNASAMGYTDTRIEAGRYRVTFQGGDGAPESQVSDYVLLRAAELTVQGGYDWFRVTQREGFIGAPHHASSVSIGTGGGSFGRGGGFGLGLGTSIPLGGGPRLTRSLEILAGHGSVPTEADVYDARGILNTIGPRVPHPVPHPVPPHG